MKKKKKGKKKNHLAANTFALGGICLERRRRSEQNKGDRSYSHLAALTAVHRDSGPPRSSLGCLPAPSKHIPGGHRQATTANTTSIPHYCASAALRLPCELSVSGISPSSACSCICRHTVRVVCVAVVCARALSAYTVAARCPPIRTGLIT